MEAQDRHGVISEPVALGEPVDSVYGNDLPQPTRRGPVTVLFSDLCGYTSLSEALDPEDLRDLMTQVFGGIARIVAKYEGHIDKLLGDAALVLFGVPHAHEDDAVRAIKAALEIHKYVEALGPRKTPGIAPRLRMHSAISTGVIVTSEADPSLGDSALGSSISLASRLLAFADPGEVVCAEQTTTQAQGYFAFEALGAQTVKGLSNAVNAYRVGSPRERPVTVHRVWGVRAKLVGRRDEWLQLQEAVHRLQHGETTVMVIRGEAGTGKSRLVEEFRDSLDPGEIRWIEASSQAYSQDTSYHVLIEALSREWDILDNDSPGTVREKIAAEVGRFPAAPPHSEAYMGSLFGLDYPEIRGADPETRKRRTFEFVRSMLAQTASRTPTVFYLGDLHWADQSSLELFRFLLRNFEVPALFVATYRPPFALFASEAPAGKRYQELTLRSLSPTESTEMLVSLLGTRDSPPPLRAFLNSQAEGNPFYIEELVNSLIESRALARNDGEWTVERPLQEADLPLTIVGVLAARLDRLDPATRRVLQEASVIGRVFGADVLGRVTANPAFESCLGELQKLDLVRVRAMEPELEYEFKHALTQEVAYSGLLKAQRRELHERVGNALESMYSDRLPELYETLARHFSCGTSQSKAVDYLVKSAEKCVRRYSMEGSYGFYREAYELLSGASRTPEQDRQLVSVLNGWAWAIYDGGQMAELQQMLESHRGLAESLGVTSEHASWCVCLAIALHCRERFGEAIACAREGLEMAEALGDEYVAACAHVWLAYGLSEIGDPEAAIAHAEQAIPVLESDPMYITEAYSALGWAYWTAGNAGKVFEIGERLLEMGRTGPSTRASAAGHWVLGEGHLADGDFVAANRCFLDSIDVSPEPWPSQHPRIQLAISYIQMERYDEAEPHLKQVLELSRDQGAELTLTPALALMGVTAFARGEMAKGMKMLDEVGRSWRQKGALMRLSTLEAILGQIYLNMVSSQSRVTLGLIARNVGFIARNALVAARMSEAHFLEAIRICRETGATGSLGEAYLGLSRLYQATRRRDEAREYAQAAIACFGQAGIKTYRRQAQELLDALE